MSTQAQQQAMAFVTDPPPPRPRKIPPNWHSNEIHFQISLEQKGPSPAFTWDSSTESEISNKAPPSAPPPDSSGIAT